MNIARLNGNLIAAFLLSCLTMGGSFGDAGGQYGPAQDFSTKPRKMMIGETGSYTPAPPPGPQPPEQQSGALNADLKQYEKILPPGTVLSAMMQEEITTETAVLGQPVSAVVGQDIYIGEQKVLSRSDRILGNVVKLDAPFEGRNALIEIRFKDLLLWDGSIVPIAARVEHGKKKTYWGGEATHGTKPEIIPYQIYRVGTYGRVMLHGPRAMGAHVRLAPGERFVLVLEEPLTLYGF